jgi:hypothetical protein
MGAILMVWLVRKKNIPREVATIIVGAWLANELLMWRVWQEWNWSRQLGDEEWVLENQGINPNHPYWEYLSHGPGY